MIYRWSPNKFAEVLKQQRLALKLSYADVGERLGMDRANVRKYETGAMPTPRIDTVIRFADALELDITDFLEEDQHEQQN